MLLKPSVKKMLIIVNTNPKNPTLSWFNNNSCPVELLECCIIKFFFRVLPQCVADISSNVWFDQHLKLERLLRKSIGHNCRRSVVLYYYYSFSVLVVCSITAWTRTRRQLCFEQILYFCDSQVSQIYGTLKSVVNKACIYFKNGNQIGFWCF